MSRESKSSNGNRRFLISMILLLGGLVAIGYAEKSLSWLALQTGPGQTQRAAGRPDRAAVRGTETRSLGAPQTSPQLDLSPRVISGGGGTSLGESLVLTGTIGQAAAGTTSLGGQFTATGGFWQLASEASPTPTPTPTPTASPTPTPTPVPNLVQFSAAEYTVQEDCTTITINVNRVGDTSGAAAVDYSTSDITASERNDYITALGRLQFASGETSKTFVVLINEDSYAEGNETFGVNLSNPSGASLGAAVATVRIIDDATEPATNALDDPRTFVCQQYHDFLNRQPDPGGWDFWTNQITSCGSNQSCIEPNSVNVSAAFFLSIEFQNTGYLVERVHKVAFGDGNGSSTYGGPHQLPVPIVRLREFLSDTQRIGDGVVVLQPGWEQKLEANKQSYVGEFVQRANFINALPPSMTPPQFLDRLDQNAGSVLSSNERQGLINLFGGAANTSDVNARAQALRAVAEDQDLYSREFNRAFVLMQYFGYLRRNPNDPQDTDFTGYDFWLTKLNQFDGNYINAEMVKAFLSSIEYRRRFGP